MKINRETKRERELVRQERQKREREEVSVLVPRSRPLTH